MSKAIACWASSRPTFGWPHSTTRLPLATLFNDHTLMDLYKNRRAQHAILGLAVVLYFTLTVLTVRTYRPWVDEAWAGTPAWSLVARGFTGTPSFDASAYGEHG